MEVTEELMVLKSMNNNQQNIANNKHIIKTNHHTNSRDIHNKDTNKDILNKDTLLKIILSKDILNKDITHHKDILLNTNMIFIIKTSLGIQ